jgi:predicted DNA-binding transcriptional regulator AlpA
VIPNVSTSELLRADEIAQWLKVPRSWVYRHAEALGAYRLGKYVRFSLPKVLACLEHTVRSNSGAGSSTQRPVPTEPKTEG